MRPVFERQRNHEARVQLWRHGKVTMTGIQAGGRGVGPGGMQSWQVLHGCSAALSAVMLTHQINNCLREPGYRAGPHDEVTLPLSSPGEQPFVQSFACTGSTHTSESAVCKLKTGSCQVQRVEVTAQP